MKKISEKPRRTFLFSSSSAPTNYKLVNSFRSIARNFLVKFACLERQRVRGNSRSRGSLSTLKVDPTKVEVPRKLRDNCNASGGDDGDSERVLLPRFSRCHDLTNTTRHFRVELTLENQIASVERSLPACLFETRPASFRPRDPSPFPTVIWLYGLV